MIIGIDIDDTITKTSENAKRYLKLFNANYQDYHDLPQNQYEEFMRLYVDKIMKSNKLKKRVVKSLKELQALGFKIIIITARSNKYSKNVINITSAYLNKHHIVYDEIIFNEHLKGECAKNHNISLFIDDKEEVLDNVSSYQIECLRLTKSPDSKYKTFTNWRDIIKYIKTKKEG